MSIKKQFKSWSLYLSIALVITVFSFMGTIFVRQAFSWTEPPGDYQTPGGFFGCIASDCTDFDSSLHSTQAIRGALDSLTFKQILIEGDGDELGILVSEHDDYWQYFNESNKDDLETVPKPCGQPDDTWTCIDEETPACTELYYTEANCGGDTYVADVCRRDYLSSDILAVVDEDKGGTGWSRTWEWKKVPPWGPGDCSNVSVAANLFQAVKTVDCGQNYDDGFFCSVIQKSQ